MHKNHFVGCAAGIAIALAIVALSGGSSGSLGVLAIVLLCPIVMGIVMVLMMRSAGPSVTRGERVETREDSVR